MYKVKKTTNPFYIDNNQAFRQIFLVNLGKLSETSTKKTGLDEIRDLLTNHVQDAERINLVLTLVSENSDHQKATGKREVMKIIGIMAEVFEDRLADFLPKIINIISKKLKENDPQTHDTLSASLGNLVSFTLRNLELEVAYKNLQSILTMLFQLCSKGNRYTQIGAAICIAKVIQSSPFEFLYLMVDEITVRIVEVIKLHVCKSHIQLFECLISLVLAFEGNGEKLEKSAKMMLPLAIDNLTNSDWNVRKIAVEVIYTLSVLVPEAIVPYKYELLEVLSHCRFDKIKNVRDVSQTAIARLKELPDPQIPASLSQLENAHLAGYETANFNKLENSQDHGDNARLSDDAGPSKWTSSTAKNNQYQQQQQHQHQQSTSGARTGLKVNPEFFNNAPKHKGDVEIFTKSPPREFIMENNASKKPIVQQSDPYVQIEESPNRTYKYTISAQKSPREEENILSGRHNPVSDFKDDRNIIIEEEKEKKNSPPRRNREVSPRDEKRESESVVLKEYRQSPPRQEQVREPRNSARKERLRNEEREQERHQRFSDDDFSNVFRQLENITNQQNKMMESMTNFQNTTLNEIKHLKSRVKDIEDFIQKAYHPQRSQQPYPYQPSPYNYALAYPTLAQPPQVQPPYHMPYSNYPPPPSYYFGPGMVPNAGRNVDPNWAKRSQAEISQKYSQVNSSNNNLKASKEKEKNERGSPREEYGNRGVMEQEANKNTNRVEVRKEHTEKPDPYKDVKESRKASNSKTGGADYKSGKGSLWDRVQDLLSRSQVSPAYELCLTEGDEETLLALMKDTGVIVEYLEAPIVENLLTGLKSRVFDETHRDLILSWIERAITTDGEVSRGTFIALHDILVQLLEEGTRMFGNTPDRVKKIIEEIQQVLDGMEGSQPGTAPRNADDEMENEDTDERGPDDGNDIK